MVQIKILNNTNSTLLENAVNEELVNMAERWDKVINVRVDYNTNKECYIATIAYKKWIGEKKGSEEIR